MRITSFCPLRPRPERVEQIACLPYDVVSTQEARELSANNPLSMLHVVRPEIDFEDDADPYAPAIYQHAADRLQALQDNSHLIRENRSSLYIYQQSDGGHQQRGIAALCHIQDYENGVIKKHENTRPEKEDDRTRLTDKLSANTGPVFLTYRDQPEIDALIDKATEQNPVYDFTTEDGIRHTVWRIVEPSSLVDAFVPVPCAYVADGHHRSASAARVGRQRRLANPQHTGDEAYNWFLCVLFPASQLNILPYNRLVRDLNGSSPDGFLKALTQIGTVELTVDRTPASPGRFYFYLAGQWRHFTFSSPITGDPVDDLDVSRLQDQVLQPLLGINDPRTSTRINFVGGIRGADYLEQKVDSGEAAIAFSLYPVRIEQLMAIADTGNIMPPKSTWFEPKLRSGLFIHTF